MLGVPGLNPFGLFHALCGVAALLLGLAVVIGAKGTARHRTFGYGYVLAMFLLNATALMIYDLFDGFGPFHVASMVSLATLVAGFAPAFQKRPPGAWIGRHAIFMCWSYVGLVAAFLAEIAVRVPGAGVAPAAIGGTVVAVVVGGLIIHSRVPRIVARFRRDATKRALTLST